MHSILNTPIYEFLNPDETRYFLRLSSLVCCNGIEKRWGGVVGYVSWTAAILVGLDFGRRGECCLTHESTAPPRPPPPPPSSKSNPTPKYSGFNPGYWTWWCCLTRHTVKIREICFCFGSLGYWQNPGNTLKIRQNYNSRCTLWMYAVVSSDQLTVICWLRQSSLLVIVTTRAPTCSVAWTIALHRYRS